MQKLAKSHSKPLENGASNSEQVIDCEECFVRGEYLKALRLANEVLNNTTTRSTAFPTETNDDENVQTLSCAPISFGSRAFESLAVRFSSSDEDDVSDQDRAAAVALQSCYELNQRRKVSLDASIMSRSHPLYSFLMFYYESKRSMPLPVAILWIQFCHSLKNNKTIQTVAVEMALEMLHFAVHSTYAHLLTSDGETEAGDEIDDLSWLLFVDMLPFVGNVGFIRNAMSRLQDSQWVQNEPVGKLELRKDVHRQSVETMLSCWDTSFLSLPRLEICRSELEQLLSTSETNNSSKYQPKATDASSNSVNEKELSPFERVFGHYDKMMTDDWERRLMTRAVQWFRMHVVHPLFYDEARRENRVRLILALFALWVSWKRRRRIAGGVSHSMGVLTFPFREALGALLPQKE